MSLSDQVKKDLNDKMTIQLVGRGML